MSKTLSQDPEEWVIDSWKKGWDTLVTPSRLDPSESPEVINSVLTEDGIPMKAPGTVQFLDSKSTFPRIRGIASYYISGATDYLYMAGATQAYYSSNATNAFLSISGVSIPNDTTTNFTVAKGMLYFHTGSNLQAVYSTGATNPSPATSVPSTFGIYWKGIHFVSGVAANPSRVYLSRSSDSSYFISTGTDALGQDAQWYDVSKDDGDRVTGLSVFRDNLVIFKERAIYRAVPTNVTSASFFSLIDVISKSVGCVSHRTIDSVDNNVFYLSRRGIMTLGNEPNYFDVIRTNEISAKVHDQIEGITPSNMGLTAAVYFSYRYRLAYPFGGTTYNNRELIYDTRYGSFMSTRGINVNSYSDFVDPRDKKYKLYYGDDSQGVVGQMDTGSNYLNQAVSSSVKTYDVDLKRPELTKFWQDVDVQFKNTQATMKIDVYVDGTLYKSRTVSIGSSSSSVGIGVNVVGLDTVGLDGGVSNATSDANPLYRIPIFKQGKKIAVKVSNTSTTETWTLLSIRGSYTPLSHYVFDSTSKL